MAKTDKRNRVKIVNKLHLSTKKLSNEFPIQNFWVGIGLPLKMFKTCLKMNIRCYQVLLRLRLAPLKYRGPILRVTSPALGSDDLTLDQSATSIQILPEPELVT